MDIRTPQASTLVSTLAVGTEITDGQISDRNSQWLSARAIALGYTVTEHRAVPDDRTQILASLRDLARSAHLIFVTGGLGPTSDDFTRECVADFLAQPLEWHEPSWASVLERLKQRGGTVTENQKQQCFFPRGATILKNNNGTANAFTAETPAGVRIVSLPGPPAEIEAIWNDGLSSLLALPVVGEAPTLTLLRTMGLGEGALASKVEEIIDETLKRVPGVDRPAVGYRAHAPYVEIKLWANSSQNKAVAEIASRIRTEFASILVNEGTEDVADAFLAGVLAQAKTGLETFIVDRVTRGELIARLYGRARELKSSELTTALSDSCSVYVTGAWSEAENEVSLNRAGRRHLSIDIGSHELELVLKSAKQEKRIALPKLAMSLRSDRGRKWAIEYALREWNQL